MRLGSFLLLMVTVTVTAATKPLLVHYMPWYVAPPYSDRWGWHWTMNHFSPGVLDADGHQAIASHYDPLIGAYDSADPVVLEYHVLLMKLAGIDGVIADWYGMDDYLDYGGINARTLALLGWVRRAGLRFSLCYEDRTIQQEIAGGFILASKAIAHAQETMRYVQARYFQDACYLHWGGQPVLLNFGPQQFKTSGQWSSIFSVLDPGYRPALFTLDNRVSGAVGAFDWPPMWLSATTGGRLTPAGLEDYLVNFQRTGAAWPAFVSTAFPRFHDIYNEAGVGASYGLLEDHEGDTLRSTLSRSMTNASSMVQLATWNDFGEGTVLEPTKQYGYRDLGIVQDLRRACFNTTFTGTTNDLALAHKLYNLRRQHNTNAVLAAELDRIFTRLIAGNLSVARLLITGLESRQPVIYNVSAAGELLQFWVGGYFLGSDVEVQMTSDPALPGWKTMASASGGMESLKFVLPIPLRDAPTFVRVRLVSPQEPGHFSR